MIWKLTDNKEWSALEKQFSWVNDMQFVEQHKRHHAEGNVAIHTQMVLAELEKLESCQQLNEQQREILWTSALMHDVEKRSTSVDEGNGIISANGHARRGEYTVRTVLYRDVRTPFLIREDIANLVRLHGLPLWFLDKPDAERKILEASLKLDMKMLKALSEADTRGRICEHPDALLDTLEYFEIFCKDHHCWDKAREFKTPNARFHYFNTPDSYVDYLPFDNFKCKVILLSGLPGMGKDHYIDSLPKDLPVISLDDIRRKHKLSPTDKSANGWVVQQAKEQAREYLRKEQDFIWNATNITRMMRTQLVDLFTSYNAMVKIVYIEKPYDIWRTQNSNREYPLPETVLDTMLQKLEMPQLIEAHEVEYMIEDSF